MLVRYNLQYKAIKFINIFIGTLFVFSVLFSFSLAKAQYSANNLVELTNQTRIQNGAGALTVNSKLTNSAYAKASDIIAKDYFAHNSPDGATPWDFINEAGYAYTYAGENLSIGYTDAQELFNAWMESTTHRQNILNSDFREIGIAVVSGNFEGQDVIVAVQHFGAAQSAQVASEQVSQSEPTDINNQSDVQPTEAEHIFSLDKTKSTFEPKSVYKGEDVTFRVTVTGEIQSLELQFFDKKINLLESGSVTGDGQKTYTAKQKINSDGSSQITVVALGKFGGRESLDLGKLTVNPVVISKETTQDKTSFWAGFQENIKNHWLTYTLVVIGLGLVIAGIVIHNRSQTGKMTFYWRF